jgi:hypothetical protein
MSSHPDVKISVDDATIIIGLLEFLVEARADQEEMVGIANRVSERLKESMRKADTSS